MMDNPTCSCPWRYNDIIDASRGYFAPALAFFGIASNLMTILVLLRVRKKSTTENLLLIIAHADLALPVMHLTRLVYVSVINADPTSFFRILAFYVWHLSTAISTLLTLVLATRRLIAIKYPHKYQSFCNSKRTNRTLMAICVFSIIAVLPMSLFLANRTQDDEDHIIGCKPPDPRKEILYAVVTMASARSSKNGLLKLSYWLYVFSFQILCPLLLAVLSVRFKMALNKKIDSSSRVSARTKLILIVSLMTLIRDLPLGISSSAFLFIRPHPSCLTTVLLLTRELTIVMSALNFFVLYYTNERFRQALPWCTPTPQKDVGIRRQMEMHETGVQGFFHFT